MPVHRSWEIGLRVFSCQESKHEAWFAHSPVPHRRARDRVLLACHPLCPCPRLACEWLRLVPWRSLAILQAPGGVTRLQLGCEMELGPGRECVLSYSGARIWGVSSAVLPCAFFYNHRSAVSNNPFIESLRPLLIQLNFLLNRSSIRIHRTPLLRLTNNLCWQKPFF